MDKQIDAAMLADKQQDGYWLLQTNRKARLRLSRCHARGP